MKMQGILNKMNTIFSSSVQYELQLGDIIFNMNKMIGKDIQLNYFGRIYCLNCHKKTKKSYAQGYCFPCSIKLAQCDMCILKPETCHYHLGTCREPSWGEEHCFKPHVIYLANSSGLKVGITRQTQIPTRWMDQGATSALAVLEVKDRLTSGLIEVIFKKHISDKTDWRKMLKGDPVSIDLLDWKKKLLELVREEIKAFEYKVLEEKVWTFEYPVELYPEKVNSLSFEKSSTIQGKLLGIKGQYLILDKGVINIRSHSGYDVSIEEVG